MTLRATVAILLIATAACDRSSSPNHPSVAEGEAIADTLTRLMSEAYDFSRPGVRERLLSLYPDSGRVISAAAGRVTTDRTELDSAIGTFWQYVGQNMRDPQWVWHDVHVDVLSRDAAVVTASYTIPHHTPAGRPHTIAGAWTAVFQRRNGRWVVVQEHLSDVPVSEDSLPVEHH
jgi:hypothetical protein